MADLRLKYALVLSALLLCGCSMTQLRQEFLGYSMGDVKNSKTKQVVEIDMSASDCMEKIRDMLKDMEAIAREDNKYNFIVADYFDKVFYSTIDTTQVGILVTSTGKDKCKVEVASSNVDLAAFVAKEIAIKDRPKKGTTYKRKVIS